MQIDSSLSGYNYHGRIRETEKINPAQVKVEDQQPARKSVPTVSSASFAGSLANVLWSVNADQTPVDAEATAPLSRAEKAKAQVQWVQSAYSEYD